MPGTDDGGRAASLAARVESGELARAALELLSLLGNPDARRALGMLPLVLQAPPGAEWPEADVPAAARGWLGVAAALTPLGRRVAVRAALPLVEHLHERAFDPDELGGSAHVGLHTGPAGAIVLDRERADTVFPLYRTVAVLAREAQAWLDGGDDAAHETSWPALLRPRLQAELWAEVAEVDTRALWACRWLVAALEGPPDAVGAAAAYAACWTELALEDQFAVRAMILAAVEPELLSHIGGASRLGEG